MVPPNILLGVVSYFITLVTVGVVDPNIQVAYISILGVAITTGGVIAVAFINRSKERDGGASEGVDAALDERDILGRMLALIGENERKEGTISRLREEKAGLEDQVSQLISEKDALVAELEVYRETSSQRDESS